MVYMIYIFIYSFIRSYIFSSPGIFPVVISMNTCYNESCIIQMFYEEEMLIEVEVVVMAKNFLPEAFDDAFVSTRVINLN